jgi:hypothetical protein
MSDLPSMMEFQAELRRLRGARTRDEIADIAERVEGGAPLSREDIERHEHRIRSPPAGGLELRTHCAALGMGWPAPACELFGYWPPLAIGAPPGGKMPLLLDFCRRHGMTIERQDASTGRVVVAV